MMNGFFVLRHCRGQSSDMKPIRRFRFLPGQLDHEITWKSLNVALYGTVKDLRFHAIEIR